MSQAGKSSSTGAAHEVVYDLEERRRKRAEAANGPASTHAVGANANATPRESIGSTAAARAARIAELKSQIANDEYHPDSAEIARKMLERGF